MVIPKHNTRARRAAMMIELAVAMMILLTAMIPIAYSIMGEKRLARATYQRAVAMELVDGELEILRAGAWRQFPSGDSSYAVSGGAATNLPPGKFTLTIGDGKIQLAWQPAEKQHGGRLQREVALP